MVKWPNYLISGKLFKKGQIATMLTPSMFLFYFLIDVANPPPPPHTHFLTKTSCPNNNTDLSRLNFNNRG